jgi:hypothetical protein
MMRVRMKEVKSWVPMKRFSPSHLQLLKEQGGSSPLKKKQYRGYHTWTQGTIALLTPSSVLPFDTVGLPRVPKSQEKSLELDPPP